MTVAPILIAGGGTTKSSDEVRGFVFRYKESGRLDVNFVFKNRHEATLFADDEREVVEVSIRVVN